MKKFACLSVVCLSTFSLSMESDLGIPFQGGIHNGSLIPTTYSIFTRAPSCFNPRFQAIGCFCYYEGKVLILKRNPDKFDGNTWGIPGGKVEQDETPRMAVIRETLEETGLNIDKTELIEMGVHYIRLPQFDFIFHMFRVPLVDQPDVKISLDEHQEFAWVTAHYALTLPLMTGEIESFVHYNRVMGLDGLGKNF